MISNLEKNLITSKINVLFSISSRFYSDQHNSKWITIEIESLLEEMIRICYYNEEKEPNAFWLGKDNENLAPHNSMQIMQEQIEKESEKIELQEKGGNDETAERVIVSNSNDLYSNINIKYKKIVDNDQSDSSDN